MACRNLHADALEWLWFVNSHSEVIYKLMYGDKDTFRLAFALAGKSNFFEQVRCDPADPPPNYPICQLTHMQYNSVTSCIGLTALQLLSAGRSILPISSVSPYAAWCMVTWTC